MCSWAHFMSVILSVATVHVCDPGFQQNKAGSAVITGDTAKPIQQGSVSLQWWELSRSVMALAAAAIPLFVYQSACCSGRPPSRIQIALFTAGRRVMARMSDGNVFCRDRRGQERSIAHYAQLCAPLADRGVFGSTTLEFSLWWCDFNFTLLVNLIISKCKDQHQMMQIFWIGMDGIEFLFIVFLHDWEKIIQKRLNFICLSW